MMRISGLAIAIFFLLFSCKETKEEAADFGLLQNKWVRLTEKNGKLVVYHSCDAGNLLLTIAKDKSHSSLLLRGQQEDYDFDIIETFHRNDTIFISTQSKKFEYKQDFTFYWTDKQKSLGRFTATLSNGFALDDLFVTINNQTNYEKVAQPCRECWGDECDEMDADQPENPVGLIKRVFDDYVEHAESTDSQEDKDIMSKSLSSLDKVTDPGELDILINVWMYYDPTDFPTRNLVFRVFENSRTESVEAIKARMENKKEWESDDTSPYSELPYLLKKLDK
jgi:hypothetical protein